MDHSEVGNVLQDMEIPEDRTCLLWNQNAEQEATVRTRHGTTYWFKTGKGVHQGCISSPYLFNLYAEYIMQNARLDEAQAGIKISRRDINNLRYHPYGRKWRRTKEPLDKDEREEWKNWLKAQYSGVGWQQKPELALGWQIPLSGLKHGLGSWPFNPVSLQHGRHAQEREATQVPGPRCLLRQSDCGGLYQLGWGCHEV